MTCLPCQRSCLFKAGKIISKKAGQIYFHQENVHVEALQEKRLDQYNDVPDSDEDIRACGAKSDRI